MTTHQREKRTLKPLLLLICFGHRTRSITHTGIRRLPLASSVQNALPVWAVDRIEVLIKKLKSSVFFMAQTGLRSSIILTKVNSFTAFLLLAVFNTFTARKMARTFCLPSTFHQWKEGIIFAAAVCRVSNNSVLWN